MSGLEKHIALPKDVATKNDLDFYFLKGLGIEYIEELGGDLWTDFNEHDPGVTIMEMLAYAITDLGNRIETPIENLLTSKNVNNNIHSQFYKASEVFPSKPVTELDYRKLFIDIEGVRNCWLNIYQKKVHVNCLENELSYDSNAFNHLDSTYRNDFNLKGLYTLLVEFDSCDEVLTAKEKLKKIEEIKEKIRVKYHENRNLCEDLVNIKRIGIKPISVCASIEVEKEANEEEIHANVLFEIEKYFSPFPKFYGVKEMLAKGYSPDEIFDGPLLDNGFIETEELKASGLRKEVRLSDLMKIIMNIKGVKLIQDISIGNCGSSEPLENDWIICIKGDKKPTLCNKSTFNYNKGVLPVNINKAAVEQFKKALEEAALEQKTKAKEDKKLDFPYGTFSETNTYASIQNDFPDTYGIGQEGVSGRATTERKAQAKQLKSYLLFFDKILANYFQHLSKVKDLLSISGAETKTYFAQAITGVKGFEDLVNGYPANDADKLTDLLFDKFDNNIVRRNEILDHLLARFAEKFGDYAFLMKTLYGTASDEIILANKEAFLKDYMAISSDRGNAFNYYNQDKKALWNTNNIAGFQKRVARLVGIKDYSRRNLTTSYIQIYTLENEIIPDSDTDAVLESSSDAAPIAKKYRWRIKDADKNIVLSATTDYSSISKASKELYFSVMQIIQTSEEKIAEAFKKEILDYHVIENIVIHKTASGKYSFHIIDPSKATYHTDYVIAKQYKYYSSLNALKKGLLHLISFMKYKFSEEGMFMVEHILLRPDVTNNLEDKVGFMPICADGCADCDVDPYSYKVSIILPGYTYRFINADFRNYIENIIKEELPAHILPKICWVGNRRKAVKDEENDLWCFEEAYKTYLLAKTNLGQKQPKKHNEHKNLIDAMSKLNTIYPFGQLIDCADESDDLEGRIILGQTNLGTQ
ncbi:hypothetical protein [Polaribacter sp.]|uniref:hypothetical protein n=1 Tax=Polaribacter sp. TaxID=1920175 RepID=UPI003EF49E98